MKTLSLIGALFLLPPFLAAPAPPAGAPAFFTVKRTDVSCSLDGERSELRVSYELDIRDPACGWVAAELSHLPVAAPRREAVLMLDGRALPAQIAEFKEGWRVGMDMDKHARIPRELAEAKSVRLELVFRGLKTSTGPPPVRLEAAVPMWRKRELPPSLGAVSARLSRTLKEGLTTMEASFAGARPGSTLAMQTGEHGASVALRPPQEGSSRTSRSGR